MALSNASRLADFGSGIGTQGSVLEIDNTNNRIGLGTTNPNATTTVGSVGASGTTLFVYGDTRCLGVITATSFDDGSGGPIAGINTTGLSTFTQLVTSGITSVTNTTAATSSSTGALIISGGVGIGKSLYVDGGISVAGTVTYNDVTYVDSVGIVTAGKGIRVTTGGAVITAGNVKVTAGIVTVGAGVTISSDFIHLGDNKKIQVGVASDLTIQHNATNSVINNTTGQLRVAGDDLRLMNKDEDETYATFANDGAASLYYDNTSKIETISAGASVYGGLRLQNGLLREKVKISSTALNSDKVINLTDGMVHYRSSAVGAASVKLNVISTAGINTDLAIGDAMAVTVLTVAGNTSHFVDQIRIDGVEATAGVTTYWAGGDVPTAGGGSNVDSYAFNILKTGNATYVVFANQVLASS